MSGLIIRDARPGDEGAIRDFLWAFAEFEKLTHSFRLTDEIIARDFMGAHRRMHCDLAEQDGTLAALMIWYRTYGTFGAAPILFLEDIFVAPEFRRRGIATALLKHLAQAALAERALRIDWAVLDWNAPAIAFYEQIGAKRAEDWLAYRLSGDALAKLASS